MSRAIIYCEDCDLKFNIEVEMVSDLFGIKCPECSGNDVWILESGLASGKCDIKLGTHTGCAQK